MPVKIRTHSPGMISVDVEGSRIGKTAIDSIRGTRTFRALVSLVGDEKATRMVEGFSEDQPAKSIPEKD